MTRLDPDRLWRLALAYRFRANHANRGDARRLNHYADNCEREALALIRDRFNNAA